MVFSVFFRFFCRFMSSFGIHLRQCIFFIAFLFFTGPSISYMDFAHPWQLNFQDAATPIMQGIINFHNHLVICIIPIAICVFWLLYKCLSFYSHEEKKLKNNSNPEVFLPNMKKRTFDISFNHSGLLESAWTILPAVILFFIAVPSFILLFSMEEEVQPDHTIKVVGHQWYWSYEYLESELQYGPSPYYRARLGLKHFQKHIDKFRFPSVINDNTVRELEFVSYDSYMLSSDDLRGGELRLLEVDRRLYMPVKTYTRFLVTSADVLHSWAVPSFGVKVDACPGRLNQTTVFVKRPGIYYGQCSEICGVNHGFMPIVVHAMATS